MTKNPLSCALVTALALTAAPLSAQGEAPEGPPQGPPDFEDSVFDGDWLSVGIGVGAGPSYDGSDDYVVFPLPILRGELGGIGITPRPAGLALDFIKDADDAEVSFSFGPTIRLRNDRADQVEDPVVLAAGELDRAFEIGPSAGVSFPALLNPFDTLSLTVDARWDVAGAHDGMVVEPSVTYFTPVSRGTAISLSLTTSWVDDSFADYYYSVSPQQSAASGLPVFAAEGGFNSAGANLLVAHDFDGNILNGGLGGVIIAGYSRQLGDSKSTPYTSIRGSADQFLLGIGLGYTF